VRVGIHVGQLLQPTPGGIGRYVDELTAALPAAGVELTPFAAGAVPPGLRARWPDYRDLGWPHGSMRYFLWHALRAPRLRLADDVDVIHAPSASIPPPGSRPLVVTVHDVAFLRYPQYFTKWGVRFHTRGLELARRDAAAIVVASEHTRAELVREGFDDARIHVVPHGVRVPDLSDRRESMVRVRRLGITEPFALFVGTIEPRKGISVLVDAIRLARERHPRLQLVIAGPRGWGDVAGLGEPWVHELGAVPDDDLDALYRTASLCAVPSRYEGFGLPALEAMARGCPLLAGDASSLPEVVGDAGVLLPVDDSTAWSHAIAEVLDDPERGRALARLGRGRASWFTWKRSADGHVAAYRAAMRR